jgi:hypothetical protein
MVEADGESRGFLLVYVLSDLERSLRLCKLRHYEHRDHEGPCAACEQPLADLEHWYEVTNAADGHQNDGRVAAIVGTNGVDLMDIDGRSRLTRGKTRWRQATPYNLNIVV